MNVVDSSGWIEFLTDGPNASEFASPIEDTESLIVPSICLAEVSRWILLNRDQSAALQVAAAMRQGRVIDLDAELALPAAGLGIDHALPLADSVIYATARLSGAEVWTQDSGLEGLPGVRYFRSPTPSSPRSNASSSATGRQA